MSAIKVLITALAVTGLFVTQATALTITNRDTKDHTVVIQTGEQQNEHALPQGAILEEACEGGCFVSLANDEEEYAGGPADKFIIQNGVLEREQN